MKDDMIRILEDDDLIDEMADECGHMGSVDSTCEAADEYGWCPGCYSRRDALTAYRDRIREAYAHYHPEGEVRGIR